MKQGIIGIKQADGKILPVLDCAAQSAVSLRFETANDGQTKAKLEFYYLKKGEGKKSRHIQTVVLKHMPDHNKPGGKIRVMIGKVREKFLRVRLAGSGPETEETYTFKIKKMNLLGILALIFYGLIVLGLLAFLATQTFQELSLERLFGIKF